MRIAVLCSDHDVRLPDITGSALQLQGIADGFAALGNEVMLIAGGHEPGVHIRAQSGGVELCHNVLICPTSQAGDADITRLAFTDQFLRAAIDPLIAFRPQVIFERLSLFGNVGVRLAQICDAPLAVGVNALVTEEQAAWRTRTLREAACELELASLMKAQLRVAVSDEVADDVRRVAPGKPTVVVGNGICAQLFAELPARQAARTALGLDQQATIIAHVGALRAWNGVDIAIAALAQLSGALLLVAGVGDIEADLRELAARKGVADRIVWLGQVPHEDIPHILAASDVAVAPYPPVAGFGLSPTKVYEYLASGTPVVASSLGSISAVLDHGRLGTLVEPGNASALARGIEVALNDPNSAAKAVLAREESLDYHNWTRRAAEILNHVNIHVLDPQGSAR